MKIRVVSRFIVRAVVGFAAGWLIFTLALRLVAHHEANAHPWEAHPCENCSIVHKPAKGCPPDTTATPGFFTEKNGEKLDGCYRPGGDGAIDVLMPGESFIQSFTFGPDDPNDAPSGDGTMPVPETRKN